MRSIHPNAGLPFATAIILAVTAANAQNPDTAHSNHTENQSDRPGATIDQMAWLAGFWAGEGFGGTVEETWNRPSSGTMVGLFKLSHDDAPTMYELQLIVEEEGSLVWKVKHFNTDFSAWEDKGDFVSFPLLTMGEQSAHFDGLRIQRIGSDTLQVFVRISRDGVVGEEGLTMTRVQ